MMDRIANYDMQQMLIENTFFSYNLLYLNYNEHHYPKIMSLSLIMNIPSKVTISCGIDALIHMWNKNQFNERKKFMISIITMHI
jgi:hypothetical protein